MENQIQLILVWRCKAEGQTKNNFYITLHERYWALSYCTDAGGKNDKDSKDILRGRKNRLWWLIRKIFIWQFSRQRERDPGLLVKLGSHSHKYKYMILPGLMKLQRESVSGEKRREFYLQLWKSAYLEGPKEKELS